MNYDWHFAAVALKVDFVRITIKLSRSFSLNNKFSYLLFTFVRCSKKKLIQQRSQQTSDRPSIPNILMMPTTKAADKNDQYAVE
jgi:hypothetical protein